MSRKGFSGFPKKASFTPIPDIFFSELLSRIDDIAELKSTLHIFWTIYHRRGYPRFVTYRELLGDSTLMAGVGDGETLRHALEGAVERGTILHLRLEGDDVYFVNNEEGRRTKERVEGGEVPLGRVVAGEPYVGQRPDIFTLYEENIGLLTPMIADELKEAEGLYPPSWIEDAFREAVSLNKRSLRYILRILERWASEGRDRGEPGRDSEEDKYTTGRYGRAVKR